MKLLALFALIGLTASAAVNQVEIQTDELGIGPFIVGGENTRVEDHPWILAGFTGGFHCGASIINPLWALSAAHCSSTSIQYGVTVRTGSGSNVIRVVQTIRHPGYVNFQRNDIALLRLESPIPLSSTAQPTRLPPPFYEVPGSFETDFIAIGWGYTQPGTNLATTLQQVVLKTVSNDECNRIHQGTGYTIFDSQICVGVRGGGKAECNGDSGSPGYSEGFQVGLSSWSIKPCGNPTYPGVFTKVSYFIDWIEDTTGLRRNASGYMV